MTSPSSIQISLSLSDPRVPAVLAALGVTATASSPDPTATTPAETGPTTAPAQRGSSVDPRGLVILDDEGAAIVADHRNASPAYLAGVQLLASKEGVTERELLQVVGHTLAGHKAATSKRVKRVLDGRSAALYLTTPDGKVLIAAATRQSLARYFASP